MPSIGKIARRGFLVGAVALTGGAAWGVWRVARDAPNPLMPETGAALSPFVTIDREGVTLTTPRAEMGQGTQTTLAALLAEELDVAWDQIRVIHGPPAEAYYNGALIADGLPGKAYEQGAFAHALGTALGGVAKLFHLQVTGGSTAMKDGFERFRIAGAAAREMLKTAAAARLGVARGTLSTEDGHVIAPDGTRLAYGDLAEAAARLDAPRVTLRPPSDWRYLGRSQPRLDVPGKVTGRAVFAMDVRPPGLRYATVRMNPAQGGTMRGFDAAAAEAMAGVEKVVDLGTGIAVIARNTWIAMRAAEAVEIDWGPAPYPATQAAMFDRIEEAFADSPNSILRDEGSAGDLPDAATEIAATYRVPFLAHATMEPMTATAEITAEGLRVWAGTQSPVYTRDACARAAGLAPDRVTLSVPYLGGGFGRRGEFDYAVLATRVAMALPGTPVQTTWSREEDMRHDFYRPGALARMRGWVTPGRAAGFEAAIATPSCARQALRRWTGFTPMGPDKVAVEGAYNQPYALPYYRVAGHLADLDVPVGFWRAVGNSHNAFFHECFIDEMAHAAGVDPMAFRRDLVRPEHAPSAGCLDAVAEMSDWGTSAPDTAKGVALCHSFGTPVAQVVEVARTPRGIALTRVWIAADPGIALDPGNLEAQLGGGCLMGLGAAISEEITFADGAAVEGNFDSYRCLRIGDAPEVSVRILETQPFLGGAGEVGLPPAAPALANALFALTGRRARTLPLRHSFDFD